LAALAPGLAAARRLRDFDPSQARESRHGAPHTLTIDARCFAVRPSFG
jgi:hypothetical protein